MSLQTIGDLAQSFGLQRQSTALKQQLDRLTQELSTGRAADLGARLSGNLLRFSQIEHDLVSLDSHLTAAREARVDAAMMQAALDQVQTQSARLAGNAITVGSVAGGAQVETLASEARGALGAILGALNSDVAGRALFAGTLTDRTPLASAETLLSELRTVTLGANSPVDVRAALDAYFDTPGGGFETTIYRGGTEDLSPSVLGDGETVALTIRGDDPALRDQLKQVALAALSDSPGLALTEAQRRDLVRGAGEALLTGQQGLTALRADLGQTEARLEQSTSRIAAEISTLQTDRNTIVSIDAFEAAAKLQEIQIRLETLYTLTARSARLSLANVLS